MNLKDQQDLVERVGLCWHEFYWKENSHNSFQCSKCKIVRSESSYVNSQIDPTTSTGMFDHVWPAFMKHKEYERFIFRHIPIRLKGKSSKVGMLALFSIITSAPDLAPVLLEYFKETK